MKQYFVEQLKQPTTTLEMWDKTEKGWAFRRTSIAVDKLDGLAATHDFDGMYVGIPIFRKKKKERE